MKKVYVVMYVYGDAENNSVFGYGPIGVYETKEKAENEIKRIAKNNDVEFIRNAFGDIMCVVKTGKIKESYYVTSANFNSTNLK